MNNPNLNLANIKFVNVDASGIQSVGYVPTSRLLYIKFHNDLPTLCFINVPGFRYEGLLAAPRKDAYYKTFIENQFMTSPVKLG
jgi:hypothetical protein